MRKRSP